jgi:serine/threonine protein kinase
VLECNGAYERYKKLQKTRKLLRHPNIVAIKRLIWEAATARAFISMELCEGGDLLQLITRAPGRRLSERTAARYTRQVLQALAHLHAASLVHGDIKPDNLLLKGGGFDVIKLCDFGCLAGGERGATPLSGSCSYLPPEAFSLQAASSFDPIAADMWSLGVTVFTMVAGYVPWRQAARSDPAYDSFVQAATAQQQQRYPEHFSSELRSLLDALLAVRPEDRCSAAQAQVYAWCTTGESPAVTASSVKASSSTVEPPVAEEMPPCTPPCEALLLLPGSTSAASAAVAAAPCTISPKPDGSTAAAALPQSFSLSVSTSVMRRKRAASFSRDLGLHVETPSSAKRLRAFAC